MKIDLSQFGETFLKESSEHVNDMESGLLELATSDFNEETVSSVFRAAHAINGGAGAFGLSDVVSFTQVLETVLDQIWQGRITLCQDLIKLLLRANHILRDLIASRAGNSPSETEDVRQLLARVIATANPAVTGLSALSDERSAATNEDEDDESASVGDTRYLISFRPDPDFFTIGADPLLLLRNLTAAGQVLQIKAHLDAIPLLTDLEPKNSFLDWEVELISRVSKRELDEIFEFVINHASVLITPTEQNNQGERRNRCVPTEKLDQLIDVVGRIVDAHSVTTRLVASPSSQSSLELKDSVIQAGRHIREAAAACLAISGGFDRRYHSRALPADRSNEDPNDSLQEMARNVGLSIISKTHDAEFDEFWGSRTGTMVATLQASQAAGADREEGRQVLTFLLDGQDYGLELTRIQEIRGFSQITPIPNTPAHIKGVLNLRGAVLPVVDMRLKFSMESVDYTKYSVIIVAHSRGKSIGLIVDGVSDVLPASSKSIQPPPDLGPGSNIRFVQGLMKSGENLVVLLDLDQLLTESEITVEADPEPVLQSQQEG